ncbi:MAG: hypothetical protein WCR97_05280 [Bacilli bacterium]
MILNYDELLDQLHTDYNIKKALTNGTLYKVERGIYSTKSNYSNVEILKKKYPEAVFSSYSAFQILGLSNFVPRNYYLTIERNSTRIKENFVECNYAFKNVAYLGITIMKYNGIEVRVYSKERMLIELVRNKNKYSLNYYCEVIKRYRLISSTLDLGMLRKLLEKFRYGKVLYNRILVEVL